MDKESTKIGDEVNTLKINRDGSVNVRLSYKDAFLFGFIVGGVSIILQRLFG